MILALLTLATVVGGERPAVDDTHWPGFLYNEVSMESADAIPTEWSPEENVAWKAELIGYGQSTPVVWNDRIFVTSVLGDMKDENVVMCLNLNDGKLIWDHRLESSDKVESSVYVSRAAPTPVVDSERVITFFESGDLIAWDHDGNQLWKRSLIADYGKFENEFCIGSSLLQDENAIYILADHNGPSYLAKLDKKSGETIWKVDRKSRTSWTSPAMVTIDNKSIITISSAGSVDGYDPATGKQYFTYEEVGGNTVATPIEFADGMFLVGASPGPSGENQATAERSNGAMKVVIKDGTPTIERAWVAERATSSFGSPIVYEGIAYWVNRAGAVNAFDAKTGESKFAGRLAESVWATPIGIGDRVYFFGQKGTTTVIKAGDEFEILAKNRLWEEEKNEGGPGNFGGQTQYGVAVVGNSLLVRTGDVLYCVRK